MSNILQLSQHLLAFVLKGEYKWKKRVLVAEAKPQYRAGAD